MADETKNGIRMRKDLRERLNRLNRQPINPKHLSRSPVDDVRQILRKPQKTQERKPKEAIIYRRDLPRQTQPRFRREQNSGLKISLEQQIDGGEITHDSRGKGFLITSRADEQEMGSVSDEFKMQLSSPDSNICKRIAHCCDVDNLALGDIIFMDIETTGLGNSPLFLIGIMIWGSGGFEVRQYLARNYAEEAAVISFFLDICADKRLLVTFNGKSYDFPYIRTRAIANGIPFALDPAHFDMLHECRRIWKEDLPNCKLQTLETHICGRPRYGDIPGADIPDAYHAYVRTENAWQIVEVLKHNMLDLVTMADLMTRFPKPKTRTLPLEK